MKRPICVNEYCSQAIGCAYYCASRKQDDALDILETWISKKLVELAMCNKDDWSSYEQGVHNAKYDLFNELRHHMLMKINPYHREDIEKYNQKELNDTQA